MCAEQVKTEGKDTRLMSRGEFEKWLMRDLYMRWGDAKALADSRPKGDRETIRIIKSRVESASVEGISNLLKHASMDKIEKNMQIFDRHKICSIPSLSLLGATPINLEANIMALETRGRNPAEYARQGLLTKAPAEFSSFLDEVERDIINMLKEETRIPMADIVKFVNKTRLDTISTNVKNLEDQGISLGQLTDIHLLESPPKKESLKMTRIKYERGKRAEFDAEIRKLPSIIGEAFIEIEHRIDQRGFITPEEASRIFEAKWHEIVFEREGGLGEIEKLIVELDRANGGRGHLEDWKLQEELKMSGMSSSGLGGELSDRLDSFIKNKLLRVELVER